MRKAIFALKCTTAGVIDEIIFNNSDKIEITVGEKFVKIFDKSYYEKAQEFLLHSYKTNETSYFEYEMNIHTIKGPSLLYFKSLVVDNYFMVIAEEETSDYYQLFASLTSMNNELIFTQKELNRKNNELMRVNELKNHLVGVAAHDLRNPIAVIHSYSDLLLEDCSESSHCENTDRIGFIEDINSTAKFMLALVEELLDLTYLESGEVILNLQDTDFISLFDKNIKYAATLGAKKELKIEAIKMQNDIHVNVDINKIQQVISNFISNAIKYSHPNSTITIACETKDNDVIFTCKDEGLGIDKSQFDIVFQPFKKANSSQYIKEQSTGLGLAISQKIILAHGGKIWLESEVNKGSTFYFSLPLNKG